MYVLFIHGPAAVGKYTIGAELSRLSGLPLFHNHLAVDAALSLFEFGSPSFVTFREAIWMAAFESAAESGRSFIFTFHPEATVPEDFISRSVHLVQAHGGSMRFVELSCPDEVLEDRIGNASRAAFGKLTDIDQYHAIKTNGGFEFPPLPEPELKLDTSGIGPGVAAQRIIETLAI